MNSVPETSCHFKTHLLGATNKFFFLKQRQLNCAKLFLLAKKWKGKGKITNKQKRNVSFAWYNSICFWSPPEHEWEREIKYEICLPYEVQTFPLPGPPSWPLTWPLRPLHCEHTRAETARIPRVALYTWWTGWRSSQCCWHIYRKDAKSGWWRTGHEIHELVNHSSETDCQSNQDDDKLIITGLKEF